MIKKTKKNQALRSIDEPLYRYRQALYLAFFSSRLYVDVGKRWKGYGFRYLLLLIAIVTIPLSVRLFFDFNEFYDTQVIEPFKKIPQMYIQNGVLSVDKPMPYLIQNKTGDVVLIIDTSGTIKTIDKKLYPHLTVLMTDKALFYRIPNVNLMTHEPKKSLSDKIYRQDFEPQMNQVFNGKTWLDSVNTQQIKWGSDFIFYPMLVALYYTLYAIFFLVVTYLAQLFAQLFFKANLSFKQGMRLFIVSSTPSIVLLLLAIGLNYRGALLGLTSLTLMGGYYCFAVYVYQRESQQLVL